ncbi:MAG: protein translocase subunit SecF [Pseudomonadota bacterium]
MRLFRFVPDNTSIKFMEDRKYSFPASAVLIVASIFMFFVYGLNLGIDFRGGTLIEIETQGPADIGDIRSRLSGLGLGDVQVQEFGAPNDVLIRIERQDGGEEAQQGVVTAVRGEFGNSVQYRRVEVVGPRVSGELTQAGTIAVIAALIAVLAYIWFRFEWHFAVGAVIALVHDIVLTMGMFAIVQLEFNLASIAAILTIVGYSLNDTVVVYDRIRENLRRYKKKPLPEVLDLSINQTLSRTALTSITTLLALIALYIFGGAVIQSFTFAMIWGVIIGTYSSIFIAAPVLIVLGLKPGGRLVDQESDAAKDASGEKVT